MSKDVTARLHTTTYDDGEFVRTAIIADEGATFVVVTPDGTPLFHVNAFDHAEGSATLDVMVPNGKAAHVMTFAFVREVEYGAVNGRHFMQYGPITDPDQAAIHDKYPWGPPFAVIKDKD